jgi:hypothetical protein
MIQLLFAAALIFWSVAAARAGDGPAPIERAAQLLAARDAAEASYRISLGELAQWCDERQLASAGKLVREWLPIRDPFKSYIFKLPESFEPQTELNGGGPSAVEFGERFATLRRAQADALFSLARRAHTAGEASLAFDLVREACRENPDHADARTILGYVRTGGGWALPDTARRLSAGQIYHDKFGWVSAGQVKQYEMGRRYSRGKWISAEDDERLHASIRTGWRIDSEHYVVTTNHSLEEGVRLARRLEQLYDVWRHVFVDYYTPQSEIDRWFKGPAASSTAAKSVAAPRLRRQHQVSYVRNRDEYNNELRPRQPQIEITLGIYFSQPRTAYFFAGDEQYAGTLLHEGAHQLFQETRQSGRDVGTKNNFALVEAVACYMESLVEHEHWYTLGGIEEGRVPAARKRLLEDQFYVPLREVTAFGMRELQRDLRLPRIYSQISGQALFLLHADNGRYRRALVETLLAIYTNKADADTLAKKSQKSYEDLDESYRNFMQTMNAER